MNGFGHYKWPDKREYLGYYKDGKKSGFGKFVWANGKTYEGNWVDGKMADSK